MNAPLTTAVMLAASLPEVFVGEKATETCERLLQSWSGTTLGQLSLQELETVKEILLPNPIGAPKALALGSSTPPMTSSSDEEEDW